MSRPSLFVRIRYRRLRRLRAEALRTRILNRLYDKLSHEENPRICDDLFTAWHTVALAGTPGPRWLANRVLGYLESAEALEDNPSLRQDVRQARAVVSLAAEDDLQPFVTSSYLIYGTHPERIFVKLTATRKEKLGEEYDEWFDAAGNLQPEPDWLNVPDYDPTCGLTPQMRKSTRSTVDAESKSAQDGRASPKAPLRRVVSRTEVLDGKNAVAYHEEQLECGHLHVEFLGANPGNRRRRCHECRHSERSLPEIPKKPVQSVARSKKLAA